MAQVKQTLRARAANLAAAAARLKRQARAGAPFSLAFMSDAARVPHPEAIARVLPRGGAFILRDYADPRRAALARRLQSICMRRGVLLIVGADLRLAREIGAAGVHLPSWAPAPAQSPGDLVVTAACHSAEDLERAAATGADLALLAPVFSTVSHPDAETLGAARFKAMAAAAPLPVLALGGVDETNADALAGPNVVGLAAIGAFLPR